MTGRGSYDILQPGTLPRTRKEELSYDPRGEGTRSPVVCHAAGGGTAERHRGLPAAGALADPVLSMARALRAVRRRRAAAPAATPGAPDPASPRRGRSRGAGLRPVVAHSWAGPDRPAAGPARGPGDPPECLGGLCDPPAPRSELAVGTAGPHGDSERGHPGAAHRTDPRGPAGGPPGAPARAGRVPGRAGVPGYLLHWQPQGDRQGLAVHGLRCRVLVRRGLADDRVVGLQRAALPDPVSAAALPPGRPCDSGHPDRRGQRVPRSFRRRLFGSGHRASSHAAPTRLDQWLRRAAAGDDPDRAVALCLPADLLHGRRPDAARSRPLPPLLQLRAYAPGLSASRPHPG